MAFVDRADIKQYIGPPPPEAIYEILSSCILELCRTNIISNQVIMIILYSMLCSHCILGYNIKLPLVRTNEGYGQ